MKKIILGLCIAIVASTSGMYVSASNKAGFPKIYVRTMSTMYSRYWGNYNSANCLPITNKPCAYKLLRYGPEYIPDDFSDYEAEIWVDQGYLEPQGNGIFSW